MFGEASITALSRFCSLCGAFYPHEEAHTCAAGQRATIGQEWTAGQTPVGKRRKVPADEGGLVGLVLGERYAIEECLSSGGQGVVYRARHIVLDSPVAVKILRPAQDAEAQRRFLVEAKLASLVRHPNTVYISDFGLLPDGRSYLVMEYLAGPTLATVLHQSDGRLPPARACQIAFQIAQGLEAVHAKGIVHRDRFIKRMFRLQPGASLRQRRRRYHADSQYPGLSDDHILFPDGKFRSP